MQNLIKKPKKKHLFKPKSLVFKNSGHPLTLSKESYRCVLACKGKCDKKEIQINKRRLDTNFADLAKEFEIDENYYGKLYNRVIAEYLPAVIIQAQEKKEEQDELIQATLKVAEQEVKSGKKIKKSDQQDLKKSLAEQKDSTFLLVLFGYLIGFTGIFSNKKDYEKQWAKTLALLIKHIYLSDKGKIESIELEKWGWYILNFVNRNYPDYLSRIKQNGVKILNEKEDFCHYGIMDAIRYFESQNIGIAMSDYKDNHFYNLLSKMQKSTEALAKGNIADIPKVMLELFNTLGNNPQMDLATSLSVIVGK